MYYEISYLAGTSGNNIRLKSKKYDKYTSFASPVLKITAEQVHDGLTEDVTLSLTVEKLFSGTALVLKIKNNK